jgi:large subunit ribosomal protein L23
VSSLDRFYQIVQSPHLTEKGSDDTGRRNAYHLRVPIDANKVEIRRAVETLFKVGVKSVNTLRAPQKIRRRGYVAGTTQAWKKAIVVLKDGDTIDFF